MIAQIRNLFELLRNEWELLIWKSSHEYRELVSKRLELHSKAMKDGTKSPYFDN